jgi:hypothetical protein
MARNVENLIARSLALAKLEDLVVRATDELVGAIAAHRGVSTGATGEMVSLISAAEVVARAGGEGVPLRPGDRGGHVAGAVEVARRRAGEVLGLRADSQHAVVGALAAVDADAARAARRLAGALPAMQRVGPVRAGQEVDARRPLHEPAGVGAGPRPGRHGLLSFRPSHVGLTWLRPP